MLFRSLEDVFPHIPFPADPAVFAEATRIGAEIRGLEAFTREPAADFLPKNFCKLASEPDEETIITDVGYNDGTLSLWKEDGKPVTAFTGLPDFVWNFAVSGYRVLPRWIEGRKGLVAADVWEQLQDVAARIAELIHWFDAADLVLDATLGNTLTREELGFPVAAPEEADESDD